MPLILGIESTCDETAASVVDGGVRVRSNVIASQVDLHEVYRGVVPEIASRAHIENLLPVLSGACETAGVRASEVDAIAVAHRPGLIGSLLVGVTAAKTIAWSLGKPLVGVDHVQAHLYSVMLVDGATGGKGARGVRDGVSSNVASSVASAASATPTAAPSGVAFPAVGLVCSGGHTALYLLRDWIDVTLIGQTIDDAVGEAYDKVSALLNLGYPGGPVIDTLAARGDPKAYDFPRSRLDRASLDFSFSGLKTSVLYAVRGQNGRERDAAALSDAQRADVAASFQAACIDVLLLKLRRALQRCAGRCVIVGGGVSANRGLRQALAELPVPVYVPAMPYCTDNAAMIAGLGDVLLRAGQTSPLDLDAVPFGSIVRGDERF